MERTTLDFLVKLGRVQGEHPVVNEVVRYDLLSKLHKKITPEEAKTQRRVVDKWRPEYEEPIIEPLPSEHHGVVVLAVNPLERYRKRMRRLKPPTPLNLAGDYSPDQLDKCFVARCNENYGVKMTVDDVRRAFIHYEYALLDVERQLRRQCGITGVQCNICRSDEEEPQNETLFCSKCDVVVHLACYGLDRKPHSGKFVCDLCHHGMPVACCFCGRGLGAMKFDQNLQFWYHVACALWLPEVRFHDWRRMKDIFFVWKEKFKKHLCIVCRRMVGMTIQCKAKSCTIRYHASCAQEAGYKMDYVVFDERVELKSYCSKHGKTIKMCRPQTFLQFSMNVYVPKATKGCHYLLARHWLTRKIFYPFMDVYWDDSLMPVRNDPPELLELEDRVHIELIFMCAIELDGPIFTGFMGSAARCRFADYFYELNDSVVDPRKKRALCANGDRALMFPPDLTSPLLPVKEYFKLLWGAAMTVESFRDFNHVGPRNNCPSLARMNRQASPKNVKVELQEMMDSDESPSESKPSAERWASKKRKKGKGVNRRWTRMKRKRTTSATFLKTAERKLADLKLGVKTAQPPENGRTSSGSSATVGVNSVKLEPQVAIEDLPSTSKGFRGFEEELSPVGACRRSNRPVKLTWKAAEVKNNLATGKDKNVTIKMEPTLISPPTEFSHDDLSRICYKLQQASIKEVESRPVASTSNTVFRYFPLFAASHYPMPCMTEPMEIWLMENEDKITEDHPGAEILNNLKTNPANVEYLSFVTSYLKAKRSSGEIPAQDKVTPKRRERKITIKEEPDTLEPMTSQLRRSPRLAKTARKESP